MFSRWFTSRRRRTRDEKTADVRRWNARENKAARRDGHFENRSNTNGSFRRSRSVVDENWVLPGRFVFDTCGESQAETIDRVFGDVLEQREEKNGEFDDERR